MSSGQEASSSDLAIVRDWAWSVAEVCDIAIAAHYHAERLGSNIPSNTMEDWGSIVRSIPAVELAIGRILEGAKCKTKQK